MSLSTDDIVQTAFKNAVQEHLQKNLRTGEDWDRFKAIQREIDARLMTEQAAYKRDFSQRMAEAKQLLLREENGLRLDEPLPSWAERHSSADGLDRKAGERVEQDHDRRIASIKRDEIDAFRDLTAEIRARDAPAPVRDTFQDRSQDRSQSRSGPSQT